MLHHKTERAFLKALPAVLLLAVMNCAAEGKAGAADLFEQAEHAYENGAVEQGRALLNKAAAGQPGDAAAAAEILLWICTEDFLTLIDGERRVRGAVMRILPPGGMKGACGPLAEQLRLGLRDLFVEPPDTPKAKATLSSIVTGIKMRKRLGERSSVQSFGVADDWPDQAARQLLALQKNGGLSPESRAFIDVNTILLHVRLLQGRYGEAAAAFDHIVAGGNKDDVALLFARASFHDKLGSPRARELFRELFSLLKTTIEPNAGLVRSLAKPFEHYMTDEAPAQTGSWISRLVLEERNKTWGMLRDGKVTGLESEIDALIGIVLTDESKMLLPGKGSGGAAAAWNVIDAQLKSLPASSLQELRKLQESACSVDSRAEALERNSNEALKGLFLRYPWSETANRALLESGRRDLDAGHGQFARRSFQDVLNHATDAQTLALAQAGLWLALAQGHDPAGLAAAFKGVNPDQKFPWMGAMASAGDIQKRLMRGMAGQVAEQPDPGVRLADLKAQVVRVPAVPLLPGTAVDAPTSLGWLSTQFHGSNMVLCAGGFIAGYNVGDTLSPVWSHQVAAPFGRPDDANAFQPGPARPVLGDGRLYARYGYGGLPSGIACLDDATGNVQWSTRSTAADLAPGRINGMPLGDPVLAENLIFSVNWKEAGMGTQSGLTLTCLDARSGTPVWQEEIRRPVRDFDNWWDASLIRNTYAMGNSVTVHEGAVYTAQSVGMVTRSDVRDGRVEWVYEYAPDKWRSGESFGGCGSAPMVVDDLVICQPRDSNWIFALDRMTGRLVWKNVMISPRFPLGLHAGRILLLGSAGLVALDVRTGAVTWELPVKEALVAWPQRVGASIVLGTTGGLRRIDAGTGEEQEAVPWPGIAGHIGNFAIHGGRLYLVTDVAAPGEDVLSLPVPVKTPAKQDGSFPAVWKLLRSAPVLYVPASDAAAGNRALVYHSGNILECFGLSATGAVAWAKMTGPDLGRVFFHNSKAALVFQPNSGRRPDAITGIDGIEMETGWTIWRFRPKAGAYVVARCGPVLVLDEGECFGALDLDSGRVLWRKSITDFKADFGQSRAMVLGNTLHVLHRQGGTLMSWMKIDPLTGTLLESKTLAGDVSGDWALAKTSFGEESCYLETSAGHRHSLVYRTNFKKGTADLVFDGVSMELYAQDHVLLRQDNMRQLYSSADTVGRRKFDGQAMRYKAMGGKLLFVTEAKTFTAIDMESGKDIWKFTEADHTRLLACGEGDGDRLFVATYDNKRTSITLTAYRISNGAKLWSQESREGQAPDECRFRPAGLNSVSGTGTWLASGDGLLWLCWNDGLYAYPDGGGASPP